MKDYQEDSQSEQLQEWNEKALAELVGLETQARAESVDDSRQPVDSVNAISQSDLFDSLPAEDPRENTTSRSLAKKPLPKLAFVAAGLLVVFGIGGLALSSMMKVKLPQNKPKVNLTAANKTSIVDKKADEENKEGQLKTQLAISKQADDLKAIDEQSKDKKRPSGVKPNEKKQKGTPTSTPTPTKSAEATTSYRPPPPAPVAYAPPPVRTPSPPLPTPSPVPAAVSLPRPPVNSATNQSEAKPTDPVEQWHRLARLGSYGQVVAGEAGGAGGAGGAEGVGGVGEAGGGNATRYQQPERQLQPVSAVTMSSVPPSSLAINPEDEERVLRGVTVKRLVPGTAAAATLSTSLVWSEKSKTEQRFVVALKEPLIDLDGNQAIAISQQLVFKVTGIDSNGLITATAVSLIDEQGTERSLPPDVIRVQSTRDKPLLAQGLFDPGEQIASMDLGMAGLGAVAKIGEILNRPQQQQQQSISGNQISTTSTSTTGNPNIIGAVMEGGATPVLESIQKRNQAAIESLSKQQNSWFLPAGESLEVVVTKAFDL